MARIAGVNIPTNKKVYISLTYIHGIGRHTATQICDKAGISEPTRVQDLTDADVIKLREIIDSDYMVEGDKRREVAQNIKDKKDMKSYAGMRHIRRLPVRGQRTKTNARTRKGKAVPIAGKKMATK